MGRTPVEVKMQEPSQFQIKKSRFWFLKHSFYAKNIEIKHFSFYYRTEKL